MPRVAVALLAALVVAGLASSASARPAKNGSALLGVVRPDPASFDRLTGKHHVLHVIFGAFRGDMTELIGRERAAGRIPVLSLSSTVAPAAAASTTWGRSPAGSRATAARSEITASPTPRPGRIRA